MNPVQFLSRFSRPDRRELRTTAAVGRQTGSRLDPRLQIPMWLLGQLSLADCIIPSLRAYIRLSGARSDVLLRPEQGTTR